MVSKTIPAELEYLSQGYRLVESQAELLGFSASDIYNLKLATDEAVTNIILHGYSDQKGTIGIDVYNKDGALVIELTDDAKHFNPLEMDHPNVNTPIHERDPGGFGIYLIKKYMDEVKYEYTNDGRNRLTMIKKRPSVH